jgi:hypothetical protein
MKLLAGLALASSIVICASVVADERRYVVPTTNVLVGRINEFPLWTDASWSDNCTRAVISGTRENQRQFCDEGFAGLKPKVGILSAGTEVELLTGGRCRDMAYVRVLTGPIAGASGCIVSNALSSVRPTNSGESSQGQITGEAKPNRSDPAKPPQPLIIDRKNSAPQPITFINRSGNTITCPPDSDNSSPTSCRGNAESQGFVRIPDVSAGVSLDWSNKPLKVVSATGVAAEAGVQAGDHLLEIDGSTVDEPTGVFKALAKKQPGEYIIVKIARAGKPMMFTYKLMPRTD